MDQEPLPYDCNSFFQEFESFHDSVNIDYGLGREILPIDWNESTIVVDAEQKEPLVQQDLPTLDNGLVDVPKAIHGSNDYRFIEISHLFTMTLKEAANQLKMSHSVLSKRWREATRARPWPRKIVAEIDSEIMMLMRDHARETPQEDLHRVQLLLQRRRYELRPATIRLLDK